ncbi:MAG: excinuclease ABC subunit UvrC [Candidatus Omnitrophica bacterium]|nr:excinuclease ABC subunit UvrC [Candidatus Omnitrophota bacterium]
MVSDEKPRLQEKLKQVPDRPGVYLFKDAQGQVLYVGKAVSLRKRVSSYFQPTRPHGARISWLIQKTADLDWIVTGSEAEALLYESSLIKEKQPKYNVSLRDDKSYPFIKVTGEEPFPRLFIGRGQEPGVKSIGPFANATLLKQAFLAIRQIIPFRTCRTLPKRACLDYYLKLCPAPCEGKIGQEAYQENLSRIIRLMEGRKGEVLKEFEGKMQEASKARRYEEAAKFRDQVSGLIQLTVRPRRLIPSEALADLQSILRLPKFPRRIEAFDVSNIYGREPVGSMVTFVDGKPWKDGYRRFKIKTVAGIDDYAMMREIVRRRYRAAGTDVPDLVVIDGGKGHLNAALEVLGELKLNLPAIGIAKEFEELFLPAHDSEITSGAASASRSQKEPILLPPQSKALQIIQRLRDEAHRFAIGYHRLLRGKQALRSALDEIPGIGPRRRQDLLVQFGSVEAIRRAPIEDLTQVRGISQMLAQRLHQRLKR